MTLIILNVVALLALLIVVKLIRSLWSSGSGPAVRHRSNSLAGYRAQRSKWQSALSAPARAQSAQAAERARRSAEWALSPINPMNSNSPMNPANPLNLNNPIDPNNPINPKNPINRNRNRRQG